MVTDRRGKVDQIIGKLFSRKLLVFLLCTVFFCLGLVTPDQWISIALGYLGVEGFADIVIKYQNSRNESKKLDNMVQP